MTRVWPFKGGPEPVSREDHARLWLRYQDAKDDHEREVAEWERRYNAQSAELLAERQRVDRWRQAADNAGNWYFNLVEAASSFLTVWFAKGYVSSDEHVAEAAKAIPALREAVAKIRDIDIPDAVVARDCSKCGGFQFREWPHWVGGCPAPAVSPVTASRTDAE